MPSDEKPPVESFQNFHLSDTTNAVHADDSGSSGYATPLDEKVPTEPSTLATNTTQPSSTSSQQQDAKKPSKETEAAPVGPVSVPFAHPLPSCKPTSRPALTKDQAERYSQLLARVKNWTTIPSSTARNPPLDPVTDTERIWLTRECLLRYLRAVSWSSVDAAEKRLLHTLTWRREYEVDKITADLVSEENATGKQQILGYDIHARPVLYMNPAKQNTKKSESQIKHVVYMLERLIDMMDAGQETTTLLINFKNTSTGGSPSVGQGKQVLTILQSHYPERLGRAIISDLPWYITTFFKLISPLIDPVTKEKMIFNDDIRKHVPPAQLDQANGGDVDFVYDHSIYWPALDKMCKERRAKIWERWVQGGKEIGEYEAYLRGGQQKSSRDDSKGIAKSKEAGVVDGMMGSDNPANATE